MSVHLAPSCVAAPPPLSRSSALFLDFDGTLAEIAPVPDAARLAPGMLAALQAAASHVNGRIALLSGRTVDGLVQLVPLPGLAFAGVHGLQRRFPDGRIEAPPPHPGLAQARTALQDLVAREPGLLLEDKALSLGLHYRDAPALRDQATEAVTALASDHGLAIQTGKMVLELRTPGADKGDALIAFMAEPPFAGHLPVFVGDDDTDEAAFRAAASLGGHGIRVGTPAPGSAAAFLLPDVASVARWLEGAE
jgi:trehalose 6-phosphate phosphatase